MRYASQRVNSNEHQNGDLVDDDMNRLQGHSLEVPFGAPSDQKPM
jgi:hypothetical protein